MYLCQNTTVLAMEITVETGYNDILYNDILVIAIGYQKILYVK